MNNLFTGAVRRILVVVMLVALAGPAAAQCYDLGEHGCVGWCNSIFVFCMRTIWGGCGCNPIVPDIEPCRISPGGVYNVEFDATLAGSEGGPEWFTPGNSILLRQADPVTIPVTHSKNWCEGCTQDITIPAGTLSLVVRFDGWDEKSPARLMASPTSLSARLPSFASKAIDGDQTGENVFALRGHGGKGYIDVETGALRGNLYVEFTNGVFADEPAAAQASIFGTFDFKRNKAVIHISDTNMSTGVIAESPSDDRSF